MKREQIRLFIINKRKELGLNQTDFGHILGVSRQYMWGIENGKWGCTLDLLDRLEDLFGPVGQPVGQKKERSDEAQG